jgi:hypothetical protein
MLKQFYKKALPSQGVYCVSGLSNGKLTNRFCETLDEVFEKIERFKNLGADTFVALGAFDGASRKADDCLYIRSFFIDLDVGEKKEYLSKEEALAALSKLVDKAGLPDPVIVDSGGGIHAYWLMDEDIPKDVWKPAAEVFKSLCLEHIAIDPVVTADAARIMRCPETSNYKTGTPRPTSVISEDIYVYSWNEFRAFLQGEITEPVEVLKPADVLAAIPKGLDDDTRAMLKLDNFPRTFETLAQKSVDDEGGCAQIKFMCVNVKTLEEPLWHAGLSIAKFCDDGATAIHEFSKGHNEYTHKKTEEKAATIPAPRKCEWFIKDYPSRCEGCQHRGKITSPISLARDFTPAATPDKEESVWEAPSPQEVFSLPEFLAPYVLGVNGGIYYMPPPKIDKKGVKYQDDPILVLPHDFYPISRMVSPFDGECIEMRLVLPQDGIREFLVPMKQVYSPEAFRSLMTFHGVLFSTQNEKLLMNYVVKWGQYMQTQDKAKQMRMQMGWTHSKTDENWDKRSFVIGKKEITHTGETIDAPSSPFVRSLSKHLIQHGTFDRWRMSMDYLDKPEFEMHAFAAMCGFGSPLMPYTSTSGVSVSLTGQSGNGKTGAMYAGLSIFGHPKDLSVVNATDNGLTGRYLGLHNILFALDEIGDKEAKELGKLIHNISHGKAKIRMQGSVNAEREHEMSAALIALFTSNHGLYGKLEAAKANPDGEAARLVEFMVRKPQLLIDNGRLGPHIFNAFLSNFGHAGPMYIKEIMLKGDNYVDDKIKKWEERFLNDFGVYTEYRFYQNLVSVNFGGTEIANEHNITNFELEHIYREVVRSMIEIRDKVVKVNRTDYPALLGEFVNKNMAGMLVLKNNVVTMEPRGAIVGRIVSEENLLQVTKVDFKKFLAEKQISSREFEFEMRQNKILFDDKKGRLTTGWKSAISVDPAYLYWFRTTVPDDILSSDS